ncbi:hypothetical protein P3T76_007337 [Phytophthora citrophthora]|uniref:Uncharacterized protein n=1 Tax=Phytophthora citrophthora TaxID=4793 RepID=A0AAD9GN34_9STRA|nr:hypothetical protein P3T76_007337 [Phytophthora citrophthora]
MRPRRCCLRSDPKPAMYRRIVALFETLKTFNGVCKKLQEESFTITSVRVLFDRVAEMYPVTAVYLSPDANIVHSPAFESAVVKVAGNREVELTEEELKAAEQLKATTATEDATHKYLLLLYRTD